jgi:hypothetical protein
MPTATIVRCATCGARLAQDHVDTICSPCRRSAIERSARRNATVSGDTSTLQAAFEARGLHGVAAHLGCSPEDAVEVLFGTRLVPFASRRRRDLLRRLVALGDCSHVAAAEALDISRWTVATYRAQLGIDRGRSAAWPASGG